MGGAGGRWRRVHVDICSSWPIALLLLLQLLQLLQLFELLQLKLLLRCGGTLGDGGLVCLELLLLLQQVWRQVC